MAVIYGWTYAQFQSQVGWEKGAEAVYNEWENYWAIKINSFVFPTAGTLFTLAAEIAEIKGLVNKLMILTNTFLKGEVNEEPFSSGFMMGGYPDFSGSPSDNGDRGSGDYVLLNKYKSKYSEAFARADNIRVGVDPENPEVYFGSLRRHF